MGRRTPTGYTSPTLGTVYRMEQGILAAGESADGIGRRHVGARFTRVGSGLRSVVTSSTPTPASGTSSTTATARASTPALLHRAGT